MFGFAGGGRHGYTGDPVAGFGDTQDGIDGTTLTD